MLLNRILSILFTSLLFASPVLLSGCSHSLVYDPSLHLPPRHMARGQLQAGVGTGYFLETLPDSVGSMGDMGGSMLFRYQVSEATAVRLGYWDDFRDAGDVNRYRAGLTADAIIALSDGRSGSQFFLIPRSALVLTDYMDGGMGFSIQAGIATTLSPVLRLYGAAGPVLGARNFDESHWGLGALLNAGLGLSISEKLGASVELSGTGYYDAYQQMAVAGISPSLVLSYIF